MFCDSDQKLAKDGRQDCGEDGDGNGRENCPEKEGVPLPQPEAAS